MDNINVPDFLDIGADVQKAAMSALQTGAQVVAPDDARVSEGRDGTYKRWVEGATIEKAWRETTKSGLMCAVVQLTIRVGMPNEGKRVWARHMLNLGLLSGSQPAENFPAGHVYMNRNSINAISTLLTATGYQSEQGGMNGRLLNMVFPIKEQPGADSPLRGKSVIAALCEAPNKGPEARTPTRVNVEHYLPDTV
jgi:hypothetical protein